MADKYLIAENFHIFVSNGIDPATNEDRPHTKVSFTKGRVLEADKIPEGHDGDDWVERGLATVPPTEASAE